MHSPIQVIMFCDGRRWYLLQCFQECHAKATCGRSAVALNLHHFVQKKEKKMPRQQSHLCPQHLWESHWKYYLHHYNVRRAAGSRPPAVYLHSLSAPARRRTERHCLARAIMGLPPVKKQNKKTNNSKKGSKRLALNVLDNMNIDVGIRFVNSLFFFFNAIPIPRFGGGMGERHHCEKFLRLFLSGN